jgi:protease I
MTLQTRTIVVLAYAGYQELELWYPVLRAREEGATVHIVAAGTEPHESFLGYPVVGDTAAADVDPRAVHALVAPGTVSGRPEPSSAQRDLIAGAHAAGRPVYAIGTAVEMITDLIGAPSPNRIAHDADGLPELMSRLRAELDLSPA